MRNENVAGNTSGGNLSAEINYVFLDVNELSNPNHIKRHVWMRGYATGEDEDEMIKLSNFFFFYGLVPFAFLY